MARRRALAWPWMLAFGLVFAFACQGSFGEGEVTGTVSAPDCDLVDAPFSLDPTFFAVDSAFETIDIRIQHGSDFEDRSDGIAIFVADAAAIEESMLGVPIPIGSALSSPVRMDFYLNDRCRPILDADIPVAYVAISGTITFEQIYAPEVDSDRETIATFESVLFVDPTDPGGRYALLSGSFSFRFSRGRPAQTFP